MVGDQTVIDGLLSVTGEDLESEGTAIPDLGAAAV
jgi:hypothetical protein